MNQTAVGNVNFRPLTSGKGVQFYRNVGEPTQQTYSQVGYIKDENGKVVAARAIKDYGVVEI